ncbi:MAG: metal-dependent transcriptional regulator [Chloroflexi bacterium]|nr:metal-dependent transcriptional regulator [Chloroflexota bacterium]
MVGERTASGREVRAAGKNSRGDTGGIQLTRATENYLLSIYRVQEQGLRVTQHNLVDQLKRTPASEGLGTSLPSVAGMLRRMERESLIQFGENKDIELTGSGRLLAERIVRRHRLAERMVVDLLGLQLHKAHVEAHRLEHAMSDDLEKVIQQKLGNPQTCPFGHPIPGSGYKPRHRDVVRLDAVKPGRTVMIDRIPFEDQQLLEYLCAKGVLPGVTVHVEENAPYRGVVGLRFSGGDVVLGLEVAGRIWVAPAE